MRRDEIWIVAGGGDYLSKPRPCVIVQDDRFTSSRSITICGLTTELTEESGLRILVEPTAQNGLRELSEVMVDKVTTVYRSRLNVRVGELVAADMQALNRALELHLGLVTPP